MTPKILGRTLQRLIGAPNPFLSGTDQLKVSPVRVVIISFERAMNAAPTSTNRNAAPAAITCRMKRATQPEMKAKTAMAAPRNCTQLSPVATPGANGASPPPPGVTCCASYLLRQCRPDRRDEDHRFGAGDNRRRLAHPNRIVLEILKAKHPSFPFRCVWYCPNRTVL
jgi:hypothetical protein